MSNLTIEFTQKVADGLTEKYKDNVVNERAKDRIAKMIRHDITKQGLIVRFSTETILMAMDDWRPDRITVQVKKDTRGRYRIQNFIAG